MPSTIVLNGNAAAAEAVKQVKPDVVTVYPMASGAEMMGHIASFAADGLIDSEIINMESGHSAMSGCIGASAAGGRVFTFAASQSLAAMHETLFIASSLRLPIVAAIVNGALAAPANMIADHADSMAERDCCWIQIFSENPQEIYDNIIQAYKIAEHMDVRIPIMVAADGFISSHSMENVIIEEVGEVAEFVGKFTPFQSLLDSDNPKTIGSRDMSQYYFEYKVNQLQGIENSRKVIKEVGKEFGNRFGRYYGFFEPYKLENAEYALVLMGSSTGTAKELIDELRAGGEKVGLLKLRIFRPFPSAELREALAGLTAVAVLERVLTPGSAGGPLFNEIRSALYDVEKRPSIFPYVYGLGGRDIRMEHFREIVKEMKAGQEEVVETGVEVKYVNLREAND
ncbi:MAG: pyruvate ferredoxin oxidoreductase [Candidatus Aminicenantes bacterium]|nr:pyruvate ferredoxin oxidoreductase [Candidatus Aminicenantes bacterium]